MSRDERWALAKKNGYCMNCLKTGHMASKYRAPTACSKCHKAHYTLLHIEVKPSKEKTTETVSSATHVPKTKRGKQVLLMACRAKITGPRVILDQGASCSFVTERLAQQLKLPRRRDNFVIAGIAGVKCDTHAWRRELHDISREWKGPTGLRRKSHCIVKGMYSMDMQVSPVDSIGQWKHLHVTGLDSADPDFETPAHIDVFLGADYTVNTPSRTAVGPTRHTLRPEDVL